MQSFDVDIDFKNRNEILALIDHTPAILVDRTKHATGIYATAIPQNPITGYASLDYKKAEELGYFKFDFLNQSVYKQVKSPEHLEKLLTKEVNWNKLKDKNFVRGIVHIGNYANLIHRMPEPIDSIEKLAMFINLLRPGKKHLQGLPWNIIEKTIWDRDESDGFSFKRSHSLAYSYLIILAMALKEEQDDNH